MAYGDAISNHAIALKKLLQSWGYASEIYALFREGPVAQHCRPLNEYKAQSDTLTFYHYSIACKHGTRAFLNSAGRKVLIYHNITPHPYFLRYHIHLYQLLQKGREALGDFKDTVELAIGDSQFNVEELLELGYPNAVSLPIILDFTNFAKTPPDSDLLKYLGEGWTNFLFTGRIVPNKAQHDAIRSFAWYCKEINRKSRLFLVGGAPFGHYVKELYRLAESLGVADHVFIPGKVTFPELVAYYKTADVFLCLSDHEGFCVPLLEAMHFDIPILAYSATGVPHTLKNAGVLVKKKDPAVVSEMAHLLIEDQSLRKQIIQGQRKSLATYQPDAVGLQYRTLMQQLEGSHP